MKKSFLAAGLAVIASLCMVSCENLGGGGSGTNKSAKLWPAYEENSKQWGYVNEKGEWAFNARFSEARDFSEGYALAKSGGALEFIGTDGNRVNGVPPIDECSGIFHNGYLRYKKDGYWGLLNNNLSSVIDPYYSQLGEMSNINLVSCQKNSGEKYGYIDKDKNQKIEAIYDQADEFIDGVAIVKRGDNIFAINQSNATVIQPNYPKLVSLGNDRISFYDTNRRKYGLLTTGGREIGSPIYDEITKFTDNGLARVKIEGKYSYINKDGQEINLSNGRAVAATNFYEGIAFVKYVESGDYEAVGTDGVRKFNLNKGEVPYGNYHNGLCLVWSKNAQGKFTYRYINTTGDQVREWIGEGNVGKPATQAIADPTGSSAPVDPEDPVDPTDNQKHCWEITYYYQGASQTVYYWLTEAEVIAAINAQPDPANYSYRRASANDENSCDALNNQDSETTYYIKHPWGGNDWTWQKMEYDGEDPEVGKIYYYYGAWGDQGCNINTTPSDNGAKWFPTDGSGDGRLYVDGDFQKGETVVFIYGPDVNACEVYRPESNSIRRGRK